MQNVLRLSILLTGLLPGFGGAAVGWAQAVKPVRVTGSLSAYAGVYAASGIEARNQPSPLGLNGAVTVSLPGGISLPFSATLGNQGSAFRQPFNQFGISPTYQWITVHAGYRNVSFSPFTLAGHTFLGGGVELNPGKFRLGAVYGRFNKAIESDLADPNVLPAFRRTGYALKLGYGTASNYVDVNVLKAADDSASIRPLSTGATAQTVKPAENVVVGVTSRLLIVKHVTVEFDLAASAYTRDVRSGEVDLEETALVKGFRRLLTPRLSSQLNTAAQLALGYRGKIFGVKLQYKRIDADFQTMGAYYFQSDLESYTLAPSLNLLGGKLRLQGSFGLQQDNLSKTKAARTGRRIGSLTASYNPGKFGIDLQFSNYGISQQAGLRPVIDTLKLAQNNLSLTLNTRYSVQNERVSHLFTLTGTRQQLSDLNSRTAAFTNNTNSFVNLGYFYQSLLSGLGANALLTYTQTALPQGQTLRFYGPTLGLTASTLERKLSAALNASYLLNQQADVNGKVLNGSLSLGYQLTPKQGLNLQGAYLNSDTGQAEQRFNEWRGTLGYTINFGR